MSDVEDDVLAGTRAVAEMLLPELPDLGRRTAEAVTLALPEFALPKVTDLIVQATQANSVAVLDALMRNVPLDEMAPSPQVVLATRGLVRAHISQDSLVRAYQVGVAYWCDQWTRAVEQRRLDPTIALRVASHGTAFLLGWLQAITERSIGEYRDEAELALRDGSMARLAEVRRVLTGPDTDIIAMSQRLGYDLRGHHVAVVLQRTAEGAATLEATARALSGDMTSAWPLVVHADVDTVWCWIPTSAAHKLPPPHAPLIGGQGRPGRGIEGFRQSHRQASEGLRIARLIDTPTERIVHFDEIELLALCSGDHAACGLFIEAELGVLAAEDPHTQRLRRTLRTFYHCNSNFRATAARLGLHHNTVRYRLEQVAELLGRPTSERRLQLELALHLHASVHNDGLPEADADSRHPRAGLD